MSDFELPQWPDYEEPVWNDDPMKSIDRGVEEILEAHDQEQRHEADPAHEPKYLPADAPGFETEGYTAAGPEEDGCPHPGVGCDDAECLCTCGNCSVFGEW